MRVRPLEITRRRKRRHPEFFSQPDADLNYIKQTDEADGEAGDQHIGLDCFGRVVDQHWIVTVNGSHTTQLAASGNSVTDPPRGIVL